MTNAWARLPLLVGATVIGTVVGYVLLQILAGGRVHDFADQCSPLPSGGMACTLQGHVPRSYWVDVAAGGLGAVVGLVVATWATRARSRPSATGQGVDVVGGRHPVGQG